MLFESQFPETKDEVVIKRRTSSILLQALELGAFVCGFSKPMDMDVSYARVWHSPENRPSSRVLLAINLENGAVVKLAVEYILAGRDWMYEVTFRDVKTGKSLDPIPFWEGQGDGPGTTPDYETAIEEVQKQVKWLQKRKNK